jgi:hypothetical protein
MATLPPCARQGGGRRELCGARASDCTRWTRIFFGETRNLSLSGSLEVYALSRAFSRAAAHMSRDAFVSRYKPFLEPAVRRRPKRPRVSHARNVTPPPPPLLSPPPPGQTHLFEPPRPARVFARRAKLRLPRRDVFGHRDGFVVAAAAPDTSPRGFGADHEPRVL